MFDILRKECTLIDWKKRIENNPGLLVGVHYAKDGAPDHEIPYGKVGLFESGVSAIQARGPEKKKREEIHFQVKLTWNERN
jgi:hypothetical protein